MEDTIVCPNCGETNPADLPYCQHCQWRLRALDGEWENQKGTDSAGNLNQADAPGPDEASVPDWLRERMSPPAASEAVAAERDKNSPAGGSVTSSDDLFSGLPRNEDDQGAIPDWVARIIDLPGADQSPDMPPAAQKAEAEFDSGARAAADRPTGTAKDKVAGGNDEINEWLRQLDAAAVESDDQPKVPTESAGGDLPDWVDAMMGIPGAPAQESADLDNLVPGWREEPSRGVVYPASAQPIPGEPPTPQRPPRSDLDSAIQEPGGSVPRPPSSTEGAQETAPAFTPDEIQRLDVDAVFASMQMPEWLADLASAKSGSLEVPPASAQEEEPIMPADLPSWIQAMRPLESGAEIQTGSEKESPLEERGPLLGLNGVLPAIPGAAIPSGRPRPQSLTLDVSERHQAHAKLLNDVLAAETQPLPLRGTGLFGSQRALRWVITVLLVAVISGALFLGSRIFPLPGAVPNESNAAIQAVEGLPTDALVLAVFDYEPATVGEMEATAAPLMDHLLLLKHPRLAVISTSPTGSVLADRFMSIVLAERGYVRGEQYVNLGYLPGGLAGVQAFAQNPSAAVPLGASSDPVWASRVLLGTHGLPDFAAIIVITESMESGRVWIEQTAGRRGSSMMILVSSAQAGPTLLPYFDSGQVNGLISGLNGAAGSEIANNGYPGLVRRYWDSYSLGLYSAVLLITIGAIWQYWMLFRTKRNEAT